MKHAGEIVLDALEPVLAQLRELDGIGAVGNRKVGGLFANLGGFCAPITGEEQQPRGGQKQAKER